MPLNPPAPTGALLPIGGAEDKVGRRVVLTRFVELAGGPRARIVVIATASSMSLEITGVYQQLFTELGAGAVVGMSPVTRSDAESQDLVAEVARSSAVFMTGGNQLKLSSVLAGTPLGAAIHAAYRHGALIGGTSAGASVLSEHMVAFGSPGATPKNRMGQASAGLGLLPDVIVDQHFTQRNRIGRLLSLVAGSPQLLGMGIDEDTGAVIGADRVFEVVGRGSVSVVDGSGVRSNVTAVRRSEPLLVSGVTLHVLPAGARFDLSSRTLLCGPGDGGWR